MAPPLVLGELLRSREPLLRSGEPLVPLGEPLVPSGELLTSIKSHFFRTRQDDPHGLRTLQNASG